MSWQRARLWFRCWREEPRILLLILSAGGWLIAISLLSKWCSLPTLFRVTAPRQFHFAWVGVAPETIVGIIDRLLNLNLWVLTPTCWKRALLLRRYLELQGIHTQVIFGVRQEEGESLNGHAWLEYQGQPLYESEKPNYKKTMVW
jgi:hypothetical protein